MSVSESDLVALEAELANPLGDYGRDGVVHDAIRELRRLLTMKFALEQLRKDIDADTDCCSYASDIDEILALAEPKP